MRPAGTGLDQEIESQQLLADGGRERRQMTQEGNIEDDERLGVQIPDTAHLISKDSWLQVSFVLITGVNAAAVLAYSGTVMVHVGWIGGVVGFILATALSFYANALLANLHECGGKRHIRYRDLAAQIYGRKGYFTIWALQYVELLMINIGFIILAGYALKAFYVLFEDENGMKLSYCNLIAGIVCFMLAILIPHLSAMRVWLGISSVLTILYITAAIVLSIKDGAQASARDYSIPGTLPSRIFKAIGSVAIMFMSPNTGMLPEIQATIREPVVSNMMKALYLQFTVGAVLMFAVVFIGYWAYGSSTSTYLLDNTTGPIWVKALANISAFLQSVISFHIYASPIYEYMDTKYDVKGSPLAIRNLSLRLGLRGSYLLISSLLAALLPFLGDFMSLTGALCIVPLTFVIPHHMYPLAKKNGLYAMQKLWHWLNAFVFACLSIAATVAGIRLIVVDSKSYELFGS